MSINITSSSKSTVSSVSSQPRDGKGRFASMPVRCDIPKAHDVTNLDSATKEIKEQILENSRKLNEKEVKELRYLLMDEIESTAPYIYNFVKDNGVVRTLIRDGALRDCMYLNKGTESYYLFFTSHNSFGFHLSCGGLAEVLNNEDTVKLSTEHNILYWDAIQKV